MTAPLRVRLSFEVTLREDLSAAEWSMTLGQALETLRPALAKGSVPVVTATRAPENRDEIRSQLRAQLDEAVASADEKIAGMNEIAAGSARGDALVQALTAEPKGIVGRDATSPLCRCGHRRLMHDPVGATHMRGECNERGCRCGLFQSAERPVNTNANAGGTR